MTGRRAGVLLLLAGAATLLRGRGAVGLLAEAAWLVGLGLAAVVVWRLLERRAPLAVRLAVHGGIALLALTMVAGHEVYGARLWIRLGPVGFQPPEFAKLLLVIFFAAY
ncbi:MAG: FtsW/RodA/SpoVE family cell cycle protein, partial [Trueperaceae bacterium]|nr:FtsW/RodA/SpoVE family cell cycle protein [Trueperaceae bacterium]